MKYLLACTVTGSRHQRIYAEVRSQFEAYAARCGCELALIEGPLDPANTHNLMTQRLLIPQRFSAYEIVAHLDIDVLIPENLPDLFQTIPAHAGFCATPDPRGTPAYVEAWGHAPFTKESHKEYFGKKGLAVDDSFVSINGGILVFRPCLAAEPFAAWYHDAARYNARADAHFNNEEGPMAYLSQGNGFFAPLSQRFNRQVHYALHETAHGRTALSRHHRLGSRGMRRLLRAVGLPANAVGYGGAYRRFVEDLLRGGNLVHFAGNYPIPRVDARLLIGPAS